MRFRLNLLNCEAFDMGQIPFCSYSIVGGMGGGMYYKPVSE